MLVSRLRAFVLGSFICAMSLPQAGRAQTSTDEPVALALGGYVRSLTGFQDLGYDPVLTDRRSGFNGEVIRLKWLLDVPGKLRVSVHNRLQARYSSASSAGQSVLGFGVSAVPDRLVDLETTLIDDDHTRVWHDLDRLAVTLYLDAVDLTVGRQAVTWGISNIFPIADLWAQFAPFELDTEEKPGLDAARALIYPGAGIELDVVVADRGASRDASAAVRATVELPFADVYGAVGKFWREFIALGGVAFVLDEWKLRGEVAVPWDLDTDKSKRVRATVGADWIAGDVQLSFEYHHNGLGAGNSGDYANRLAAPEFARGESYYIGRHYLGAVAAHQATDRLTLALTGLANLGDPSLAVTPVGSYDFGQNTRVSIGALTSFGTAPVFSAVAIPQLDSEFGLYGDFVYTQVSVYF